MKIEQIQIKSETGRYSWLYREALQQGYIDDKMFIHDTGTYWVKRVDDPETQIRAWLNESLITALEHHEPLIRVRAALQAFNYSGRLEGMGAHVNSSIKDALSAIRNRIEEGFLPSYP